MLVSDVLRYWYGIEIPKAPRRFHGLLLVIADSFSIPLLLRTLFAPWRKDVVAAAGQALPEKMRAFWYNLVAILIGFVVRVFVLFVSSLLIALATALSFLVFLLWLILPALPILLFFVGIVVLFRG